MNDNAAVAPAFIDVELDINYTNHQALSIPEVVQALESAEKLILHTKPFLAHISAGYDINEIQVFIVSAKSGSFFERLRTRVFFSTPERQEKAEDALIEAIENTNMNKLLPAFFGIVVGAGAIGAYDALHPDKPSNHINAFNNQIVNISSENDLSAEELIAIIEKLPKQQIARDATKFISPAKADADASIHISSPDAEYEDVNSTVSINRDVIAETPEKYEPPQPTEKTESFDNVMIEIVALDVDNPDKWQGIIRDVADKRTKLTFSDDIDISKLSREKNRAHVEVTSKFKKSQNKYIPTDIHITSIIK